LPGQLELLLTNLELEEQLKHVTQCYVGDLSLKLRETVNRMSELKHI